MDISQNVSKIHYGAKCKYCDSTETYFTDYIGMSSPNIHCNNCGAEYFVSPTFKLQVRDIEVDVKLKQEPLIPIEVDFETVKGLILSVFENKYDEKLENALGILERIRQNVIKFKV